jgi:CheY-like chemotaxis protein
MGYTLLLADDSLTTHRVMELTFAGQGIRVMAVADGEQALDRMRTDRPDILMAEVALPSVDGYRLSEHVRSTPVLADVPVLLLTGAFDVVDEARVSASGASGIIIKPFEPEVVIKRVKDLLGISPKEQDSSSTRLVTSDEPPTAVAPDIAPEAAGSSAPTTTPPAASPAIAAAAREPASIPLPPTDDRPEKAQVSPVGSANSEAATDPAAAAPPVFEIDEEWFGGALAAQRSRTSAGPAPATADAATAPGTAAPNVADSFHALLAAEQDGAPVPAPVPIEHSALSDEAIERIALRVADRLSEGVFVETVRRVVEEVAERLVREEIAHIRAKVQKQQ